MQKYFPKRIDPSNNMIVLCVNKDIVLEQVKEDRNFGKDKRITFFENSCLPNIECIICF